MENGSDPAMTMLVTKRKWPHQQDILRFIAGEHDLANKVLEFSREAIVLSDRENNILSVNQAFTEITGYSADEVVGKKSSFLYPSGEDENAAAFVGLQESILADGYWQGEILGRRKNGEIYPKLLTISVATDKAGEITHYISLFSDIIEQKRETSRSEYLAHHDALTGLPNRVLFHERLSAAISLAHRHGNTLAVLCLNLDNFKQINDKLGQGSGDQLLQQVAERLTQCIRESDAVARLEGDEFAVLLNEVHDQHSVEEVAKKILLSLGAPFELSAQKTVVSASIGIALFPKHGTDNLTLLDKADAAMYKAKLGPPRDFQISLSSPA